MKRLHLRAATLSSTTACAAALLCGALLAACSSKPAGDRAGAAPAPAAKPSGGLQLSMPEQSKLGLEKAPAGPVSYRPEVEGFALVLNHEAIAQAAAEVTTMRAAEAASHAALARAERLRGTQGAVTAEGEETVRHQAAADAAALALAQQRLTAQFGQHAPWLEPAGAGLLGRLAAGQIKLVRVTFALDAPIPRASLGLRFTRLQTAAGAAIWSTRQVWPAPADASVPGRSYFAALSGSDAAEGERLAAWAGTGDSQSGVLIPAEALVISEGKTWCYLEKPAGTFVRVGIDTARPLSGGYFVQESIAAGDTVVTGGAGLLLARESSPDSGAE
jgi:hypothetical protein